MVLMDQSNINVKLKRMLLSGLQDSHAGKPSDKTDYWATTEAGKVTLQKRQITDQALACILMGNVYGSNVLCTKT